jgi:hypothetical protein
MKSAQACFQFSRLKNKPSLSETSSKSSKHNKNMKSLQSFSLSQLSILSSAATGNSPNILNPNLCKFTSFRSYHPYKQSIFCKCSKGSIWHKNLKTKKGQRSRWLSSLARKCCDTSKTSGWTTRQRCAETGCSSEAVSLTKTVLMLTEHTNSSPGNQPTRTTKLRLVKSGTKQHQVDATTATSVNSCTTNTYPLKNHTHTRTQMSHSLSNSRRWAWITTA